MVLPSKNEGFSISCIEAFALRVPVIRTKTGGYTDMKDYCIGVNYGDINELRDAIVQVITNKQQTAKMVDRAYYFFKSNLTSETMVKEVYNLYKELIH
jgi:glycosyltransferase involved in cell wall biosynthesis